MLPALRFLAAWALAFGLGAAAAGAVETPDPLVESILTRALTERGASHACALFANDADAAELLSRSWRQDMQDSVALLRGAGYPDSYLAGLETRMTIEAATPLFRDNDAAAAYCAALGDWKHRFETLLVSFPQFELKRRLEK